MTISRDKYLVSKRKILTEIEHKAWNIECKQSLSWLLNQIPFLDFRGGPLPRSVPSKCISDRHHQITKKIMNSSSATATKPDL